MKRRSRAAILVDAKRARAGRDLSGAPARHTGYMRSARLVISLQNDNGRVDVLSGLRRPIIGSNPVQRPYLFIGAAGLPTGRSDYECVVGFAQPIFLKSCPTPVDSKFERKALGTLRTTLKTLDERFEDTEFELEKPAFEIDAPDGPCLPDFLIRARRGSEVLTFVIEVMGSERTDCLEGKEATHPRMKNLGTLREMWGSKFDHKPDGLKNEGTKVTNKISAVLRSR